jgi:transposase
VIADKAYSAAWLLDAFRRKRIVPTIPNRADQPENPDFDRAAYRRRNAVENLFGRVKDWTRIVLRKDKTSRSYAGFVSLAFALINIQLCP